jgi:hypothetical protein
MLEENIRELKSGRMQTNIHRIYNSINFLLLVVNAEKNKYMLLSRHQNAEQDRYLIRDNRAFENVSQFKYFGMTGTN